MKLIHRLASLRLTIVLLVTILLVLAAGTIVESLQGAPAAARLVYGAPWFHALLAGFALNLVCSLVDLWPWGKRHAGYVITHGSMLLILAGALASQMAKVEGQLPIWEGESANALLGVSDGGSAPTVIATLPFAVQLDAFEIDYYQGTRMPASYRSRVTVRDGGRETRAVIEMNRELSYGSYRFYQSSYREAPGREQTILSVSKDPGQTIVFLGYYGLVAGMLVVLGTRIASRRRTVRAAAAAGALLVGAAASAQDLPPVPPAEQVEALRHLPVQHDGRLMPLDTLAREGVFKVTGRRSIWGLDPVATALGWALEPHHWVLQPIVPVKDRRLARAIGLPAGVSWSSFQALTSNQRLLDLVQSAHLAERQEHPLSPLQRSARRLEGRLLWLQRFLEQEVLRVVPAERPGDPWSPPQHLRSIAPLRVLLDSGVGEAHLPAAKAEREVSYNRARATRAAWIVLLVSLVLGIVAWNLPRRGLDIAAGIALFAGFAVMSWEIAVRWSVSGRIPASNMYESLLFLGWGIGAFAVVAMLALRNRIVILNAAAMSALTMALTDLLPIDPFIHPMPPVLAGTYWLAVHVPIIMAGYSVLALGTLAAHMQLGFLAFSPSRRDSAVLMGDLLYWYTQVGSILLAAGIATGSMWAASSWGRYWGWDPKEVWSLVAFLAYMAILHGRREGLLGSFGIAAWSIVAFQTILMTYLGVNYVLASGLHTYGFGESNVVWAMLGVAVAEVLFVGLAWLRVRRPPAA
jgi:ABC-type transport system involved in cytochrome c biogenesis permease subunit